MEVLLSGLLGALLVFCLGWLREWYRNERERRGLLRLLSSEIQHNAVVTETIRDSGRSLLSSPATSSMTTETWRESRESAISLPSELLEDLDGYYRPLEILLTLRSFPGVEEERLERFTRRMLGEALGREFVRSRDPWGEYEQVMLQAQDPGSSPDPGVSRPAPVGASVPEGGRVAAPAGFPAALAETHAFRKSGTVPASFR